MKILWVTTGVMAEIAAANGLPPANCSGWLSGILNGLQTYANGLEITVCFPYGGEKLSGKINGASYESFFEKNGFRKEERAKRELREIIARRDPDVIHIFGLEYPHALSVLEVARELGKLDRTVINIQGLISVCARHYEAGLPPRVVHACTLRDFLRADNIAGQKRKFAKRGEYEIAALKLAKQVIGRTEWDRACVLRQNADLCYYKCYETLRSAFYEGSWTFEGCEPYSVFVSQWGYSLKGFHMVLEAFADLVKKYPAARLYTTGQNPAEACGIRNLKHKTYYAVYIKKLIDRYGLQNNVVFLGGLDAEGVKRQLLKANAFVLSSSVENSSNSLGEAMLLGLPCVASDVGGVKTFVRHGENGLLYPFDEPYMLANYLDRIFSDPALAAKLGANAKASAAEQFDRKVNAETLCGIYQKIAQSECAK